MSRGPWIYVTVDHQRDVALVRGDGAVEALDLLGLANTWSASGRGWVIDAASVPDVAAFGQSHGELVVVHDRKEAT